MGRFFCNIRYPDGRPFEGDGRYLLQSFMEQAAQMGLSFQVGPECEFYLFRTDERGEPTLEPQDRAGYFDIAPLDRGENVRREICLTLEEMGVQPERSHHEQGPGQNEVDFHCSSPLRAADNLMALRFAVKALGHQNGLFASFLPKPLAQESGSGLHINLSLYRGNQNLFQDFNGSPQPEAASFLAGILAYIPEFTAICNPLPGSYRRLGRCEAPSWVNWSRENRSTLVRVPAAKGEDCRIEVRSPDPSCNPYYAILLLLRAGMEGIQEKLTLPPPFDQDAAHSGPESGPCLPAHLGEALLRMRNSGFVRRSLPSKLVDRYLDYKEREFRQYLNAQDQEKYELERYFPLI